MTQYSLLVKLPDGEDIIDCKDEDQMDELFLIQSKLYRSIYNNYKVAINTPDRLTLVSKGFVIELRKKITE